jgi:hypothetical protein
LVSPLISIAGTSAGRPDLSISPTTSVRAIACHLFSTLADDGVGATLVAE